MSATQQVAYETRVRTRHAIIAGLAGLLFIGGGAAQLSAPKVPELTVELIFVNKHFPLDVVAALLEGLALVGLAWTLSFLFVTARARKPEMHPAAQIAVIAGGAVSAVAFVASQVALAIKAHQFVTQGEQTYSQANHLAGGFALPGLQTLNYAAAFALAIGLVLISLNAMRVGLLTRFLGYFGILVAVASVFLIGTPPAVLLEVFWLLALAYLFAGRWPGGDPPAWRSGRAEPWPSAAEMREQREKTQRREQPEPQPAPATSATRTRSSTPKRKRKKRR